MFLVRFYCREKSKKTYTHIYWLKILREAVYKANMSLVSYLLHNEHLVLLPISVNLARWSRSLCCFSISQLTNCRSHWSQSFKFSVKSSLTFKWLLASCFARISTDSKDTEHFLQVYTRGQCNCICFIRLSFVLKIVNFLSNISMMTSKTLRKYIEYLLIITIARCTPPFGS